MKKRIILLGIFSLLFSSYGAQASGISLTSESSAENVRGAFRMVTKAWGDFQDLNERLREKNISLEFEKNLSFPSLIEINRLEKEIAPLDEELEELQDFFAESSRAGDEEEESTWADLIHIKVQAIESLQEEKSFYDETYQTRKTKQQTNIRQLTDEISDLEEEIQKQKQLIQTQVSRFLTNFLLFFGIILILFLGRTIFGRIISRVTLSVTEHRRETLLKLNRIIFNVLIGIFILGVLFSQFVNLLPFVAILGTGLAFAVRDAISSFIGWFIIGTDRGYRVGDIIEIGDARGKVQEIGPFLTMLHEIDSEDESGKMITFANKMVFEHEIINLSRCYHFLMESVSFLLAPNSDLKEAKTSLLTIIKKENLSTFEEAEKISSKLQKHCGLNPNKLIPEVWIEPDPHGIKLKASFIIKLEERKRMVQRITETFLSAAQRSKFQLLFLGDKNNHGLKSARPHKEDHLH
ncbi:mechanosensitive ion channel [Candidatus Gracilibacteria bacterium]|nr:mechanosensitive ion channel [Candidatus Gracilibacteria bacterium]